MDITFVHSVFMKNILLLIACCLAVSPSMAFTLRGKVTEVTNGQPLFPVTVVNIRTQQATYTTENGSFLLSVQPGDRVAFSYVGYKVLEYTAQADDTADISIRMVRTSYFMKEVLIMPNMTQYQVDSVERASTYRGFLTRTPSNPIGSPVSFIAEKFNKRSKQIFRFQKKFHGWENERFIDTRYTPELVSEMTGLTDDSLAHFINANPMPYDYARAATDLELKMWIRDHYRQWLKIIDTAGLPVINENLIPVGK